MPTLIEAGYPGFDYYVFYGVLVPAGDGAIVIAAEYRDRPRHRGTRHAQGLAERGVDVRAGTAGQFDAFLASERAKWERAVKESGATVD